MSSRTTRIGALLGAACVSFQFTGCASLESDIDPDQLAHAPPVGYLADTDATDNASRLVISNYDNVYMIDGDNGELVASVGIGDDGESWFFDDVEVERQGRITVGGETYTFDEATSQVLTLPQSNRLIVFDYDDYESGMERITAVDLESGDTAWHHSDYLYSLQQYEQFLDDITQDAGEMLADALGGDEGQGENSYNRRERQRHFMRHTMATVNDGESILFKTFNGLVSLDAASGAEQWRVEDFNGPGIQQAKTLDNGDYLVLSTGRDLGRLQAALSYNLARIAPDGAVRWISDHSGARVDNMTVAEGRVAVDAWPLQVFDLETGEHFWENDVMRRLSQDPDPRAIPQPEVLIQDGVLYQTASTHKADEISIGAPHRVRAYELDSGNVLWESDEVDTYFGELHLERGHLLVWGAGEFFGDHDGGGIAGLDPQTGEVRWHTPEMETPGLISQASYVVSPVFDAQREHVFIAGPEDVYGVAIDSGELTFELNETGLGSTLGLLRYNDDLVVVGEDGVGAYSMTNGTERFAVESEQNVIDYYLRGDRLVLEVSAGGVMAMADRRGGSPGEGETLGDEAEDVPRVYDSDRDERLGPDDLREDPAGLMALDLTTGSLGDLAAWQGRPWLFGVLQGTSAVVSDDGHHAWIVNEEGALMRYSL